MSDSGATKAEMSEISPLTEWVRNVSSSKFNYWAGYVANLSLVAWLLSRAHHSSLSLNEWLLCGAVGFFIWTLAEYVMHRYLYHEIPSVLATGHDLHHQEPKALLGVPWYLTTVVLVGIYYGLAAFLHPARTGIIMAFAWLGYIGYCLMHHAIHHWTFSNAIFKSLRKHHLLHHHHHDRNWGILTDVWDRIFRTKV